MAEFQISLAAARVNANMTQEDTAKAMKISKTTLANWEKVKGSRDEYKRVRADDYMVVDGMHEAIIAQETWEATRLR